MVRRGCYRLTPFGGHSGGDSGSPLCPLRSAHAPASGPPEGALMSPQLLTASPPTPALPTIGQQLSSDGSPPVSVTSPGAGRGDARRPGSGRCPAPAAAGRGVRQLTRGRHTAAVQGGVRANPSRSPPTAAATTGLSSCPGLSRPSMRDRAAA